MSALLEANTRESLKRSATRQLRLDGYVPAVLYGKETESTAVSVPSIAFVKTLREVGRNGIIDLDVAGNKTHKVIVHDMQVDPIKNHLVHIDFFEVDLKSEMEAEVAVNLVGEAPGEKDGGVVSLLLYNVSVRALPAEIPEEIEVDISGLNIGDAIQIADLTAGKGFEFVNDPDETVVTVLPPDEEPVEEEDEVTEPELVENTDDEPNKEE
ncbi:50S ribosomal protein L25/general stress protein Ctc [Bacillus piscicola]|uniref:50S ribosomal protein L25/general stress protein Ctc n=1 Tax=Bacillus piscicola TaxID=1632684 RepID=UPI001F097D16|nr:50S ribosomal protein L25/general stress protein Ctc [Bacillus piscicola]